MGKIEAGKKAKPNVLLKLFFREEIYGKYIWTIKGKR